MLRKICITTALFMGISSHALAIGWTCNNQWGGHYRFDGSLNTVTYMGPMDAADVVFGRTQSLAGLMENVQPLVGWQMSFGSVGYAYNCVNTTMQTATCTETGGQTLALALSNCRAFL